MKPISEYTNKPNFDLAVKELKDLLNKRELIDTVEKFADEYDYNLYAEEDDSDFKEVCKESYLEGIKFAISYLEKQK